MGVPVECVPLAFRSPPLRSHPSPKHRPMLLGDLLEHVDVLDTVGDLNVEVRAVTRDSRIAGDGVVFVAIRGANVDGHDFIASTTAAATVVERSVPSVIPQIRVADAKCALAQISAALNGFPSRHLSVVGVTGTNGKTTVTGLIDQLVRVAGKTSARVGTTGRYVNGVFEPSALTTPEAPELQRFLARMVGESVAVVAMEVSSIGLVQRRVDGIQFQTAAFTNLTQDHLNFHGDMAAYAAAKSRLFSELLRPAGGMPRAIVCAETRDWEKMGVPVDRWTYGRAPSCDLTISEEQLRADGARFLLTTPLGVAWVDSPLIGGFNIDNLVCAIGIGLTLGLPLAVLAEAARGLQDLPGRLERVPNDRGVDVFVDYAHTPDAIRVTLQALRRVVSGELWMVFGCGGNRDPGKRPLMGQAAEIADHVVVTSDNPRTESPQQIIDSILSGMDHPPAFVHPDRRLAIAFAVTNAKPGDAVVIAGKGHEDYQETALGKVKFDDRVVAAECMRGAV